MKLPALRNSNQSRINSWVALSSLILLVVLYLTGTLPFQQKIQTFTFDLYQNFTPRERVSAPVVIIDIDETSLQEFGQWPWPRTLLAKLIESINEMNPAAVAIDIIMPEPDRSSPCLVTAYIPGINPELIENICQLPGNDELLAAQLSAGNITLGVAGLDEPNTEAIRAAPMRVSGENPLLFVRTFNSALQNIPVLEQAAAGQAILSTDIKDGIVRRVPLIAAVNGTVMPSLSLEILRLATGSPVFNVTADSRGISTVGVGDLTIPTLPDGALWVNYSPHDPTRFVSARDVLQGNIAADLLERKLVLLGFTGLGLVDFPTTALGERVPGVEIHAQVLESIFDSQILQRPFWALWLEAACIFLLGAAAIFGFPLVKAWLQLPGLVVIVGLLFFGGHRIFSEGLLLIDITSPALVFMALYGIMLADSLIREEAQIEELEDDLRQERDRAAKIQGEMEAAKRFQMGIVPDAASVFAQEPRLDIAATMEPAKMVGGDLYDFFMLDAHRVFFSLGDVCGKGVPASLFMVISKTLCKSVMLRQQPDQVDLGELMSQANIEICRDNPEMLFVTLFVGIIDLRNGHMTFCNAGHERPILIAPDCFCKELQEASGPPIGVLEDHHYRSFNYVLSQQEFLCIFSDGLTESTNHQEVLYGHDKLVNVVSAVAADWSAQKLMHTLVQSVLEHAGDTEPADDLTILILRWQGPEPD